MMRHKLLTTITLLALAVSACQANATATPQQAQTATVTRGTITATISAAGTIAAKSQVTVTFQNSGQVKTVSIKVGDHVKAGQVMATLEATELEAAVVSAQAGLEIAQAQLAKTKQGPLDSQVKAAQAALASATAAYRAAQAKNAHLADQLMIEQNNLDNVSTRLNDAQNSYNNLLEYKPSGAKGRGAPYVPPAGEEWSSQKATLDNATIDYNVALANYNLAAASVNNSGLKSAAAQLAAAQATLDNLKNTPTPEDVALAEASVRQAQIALQQAQSNLRKAQLVAPFDGVVADLNIQVGQQAGSTQTVILVDLSQLVALVNVSESDLPKVKVGQPIQVTFDALPGQTFSGHVIKVALTGVTTQGVVNYPVTVVLDQADTSASLSASQTIRSGMTANVSIVVEQLDNVLLVPNRAVKTSGKQKTVTVLSNGKPTPVNVTLGMSNDTQSQVTSGLNEGDVVEIQQTTTTTGGGFGGPGGGFGGPGGGFGGPGALRPGD